MPSSKSASKSTSKSASKKRRKVTQSVSREYLAKVRAFMEEFHDHPKCATFRERVNWKKLGLDDYPEVRRAPQRKALHSQSALTAPAPAPSPLQIIDTPMDLGLARRTLDECIAGVSSPPTHKQLEKALLQMAKDVQLTFQNAITYNEEGSSLHEVPAP
uniref:Bromo domain-containing protein n=1 Tax=Phaeomonas parva TaxID=124430 RepID=A0A7S1U0W5_9STRA|mmetsp:Transcript_25789/g.80755  ORF Transcript_25789/g.80755 Transcript_25789/m.80755 type:complete len:159 (+) Transcript_25789:129-605(+)